MEQQHDHFAKLEVREVRVDNGTNVTKGCRTRGHGSNTEGPPDVYDFDKIAIENPASSFDVADAAMNISR